MTTAGGAGAGSSGGPGAGEHHSARSTAKRAAITDAATRLFLERGYAATTMEDVAGAAAVSKQTVYAHFADKPQLLRAIVLGISGRSGAITSMLAALFDDVGDAADLEAGVTRIAERYAAAVLAPDMVRLRRLVLCEATRFPDLAASYFEQAPAAGLAAVAAGLTRLGERGLLRIDDPGTAAVHFAYLVLGPLLDRALFHPGSHPSDRVIRHQAAQGAAAFVRAYAVRTTG